MTRDSEQMKGEHLSTTPEHFTPAEWVELARRAMGGIYTDPASCAEANETVKATVWHGVEDDGLLQSWVATVLLNPPGSCHDERGNLTSCFVERPAGEKPKRSCTCSLPAKFFSKLKLEVDQGSVTQFVWIAFNISQLRTLQHEIGLLDRCLVFIPAKRIKFTESSPTKDNAILYYGPHGRRFANECAAMEGFLLRGPMARYS